MIEIFMAAFLFLNNMTLPVLYEEESDEVVKDLNSNDIIILQDAFKRFKKQKTFRTKNKPPKNLKLSCYQLKIIKDEDVETVEIWFKPNQDKFEDKSDRFISINTGSTQCGPSFIYHYNDKNEFVKIVYSI